MGNQFTSEDKLAILARHEEAFASGDQDQLLATLGISKARFVEWWLDARDGTLTDDPPAIEPDIRDDSIYQLAVLHRAVILQRRVPQDGIANGRAAWAVIHNDDGSWRADYLARARSALRAIFDEIARHPDDVLHPRRGTTPEQAIAHARAYVGVDTVPSSIELDESIVDLSEQRKERAAEQARLADWAERISLHPSSFAALDQWFQTTAFRGFVHRTRHSGPVVWKVKAEMWPPEEERGDMLQIMHDRLGSLDNSLGWLTDDQDRHLEVLRRRVVALHSDYIRGGKGNVALKWHWQHNVVRPWLKLSMEDFRTQAERSAPLPSVGTRERDATAAIAAMCFYTVLAEWDDPRVSETIAQIGALRRVFEGELPEQLHRERATMHRARAARMQRAERVEQPPNPSYVRRASAPVQELFHAAETVRAHPNADVVQRYLSRRSTIKSRLMRDVDLHVLKICDYTVNLATATRRVRAQLRPGQLPHIRAALLASAGEAGAYSFSTHRNDALSRQGVRTPDLALATARHGLDELQGKAEHGSVRREREYLEMVEQMQLNIAGSAVQWLEHLMTGDDEWLAGIERAQWRKLVNQAMHAASDAMSRITELWDDGVLDGPRYITGYISDLTFVFRAFEIYYRCVCVSATVAATFGFDDPRELDYPLMLIDIYRQVTTLPFPIPDAVLPRLMHSILWHAFLARAELPALHDDDVNQSLIALDALSRPLKPEEKDDPDATTTMTLDRLKNLTDWLIGRRWSAGALGRITPDSAVWRLLHERSGGLYTLWREAFGDDLLLPHER